MKRRAWVWPIAVTFTTMTVVYWGYRMMLGGGIGGGEMVWLISSVVTSVLLLWLGWKLRRSTTV